MTYSNQDINNFALPLPIPQSLRITAQELAQRQPTPDKAEQVLLNILAVSVVDEYLQMLGITTDLDASDCFNPAIQLCADIANLVIPEVGTLECRPLKSSQLSCFVPPEVAELRIGYVVVAIEDSLRQARLLGYTPTVAGTEISLFQLQAPEALIDYLHDLQAERRATVLDRTVVNLSQWLNQIFTSGWQAIETLWNDTNFTPALALRSQPDTSDSETSEDIRRAKIIDLGMQFDGLQVALIVSIKAVSATRTDLNVQLHPFESQLYLPAGIELTILDESEVVFMQAQARIADNYLQLQFGGEVGECFTVSVALDNAEIRENFVI